MKRRIHRSFLAIILTFSVLLLHLVTIIHNDSFLTVGLSQSSRTVTIATQRGTIYDRNLTPLVNAEMRYCAALFPEIQLLDRIRDDMTDEEYRRLYAVLNEGSLLVAQLTNPSDMTKGLRSFQVPDRYEETVSCAHLLGYLDESGQHGQTGIEKAFDSVLNNYTGKISVTYSVNGAGDYQPDEPMTVKNTISYCAGGIQLTIDKEIQQMVDAVAKDYISKGAVVVMDPYSGELLACTSLPDFHPGNLQDSIDQGDGALVNRMLSQFDCGSVFKIITAAAALENGVSVDRTYSCAGNLTVGDTVFHCHQRLGHQTLTMEQAFAQSCNLYFIQLAQQIGGDTLLETAEKFKLCDPILLADNLSAPATVMPSSEELYPAALANLSFGQGKLLITPLHVAQMTAVIAAAGTCPMPSAVLGTVDDSLQITSKPEKGRGEASISAVTASNLRRMMELVVSEGTGTRAQLDDVTAAGKTGTAETGQYNDGSPVVQSWFTGYFPAENPQYVITVLAEDAQNLGGDAQGLFCEISNNLLKMRRNRP